MSDCIYKIRWKRGEKVLHHDRLRPYVASDVPKWVERQQNTISLRKDDTGNKADCEVATLFSRDNGAGPVTRSRTRAQETMNRLNSVASE